MDFGAFLAQMGGRGVGRGAGRGRGRGRGAGRGFNPNPFATNETNTDGTGYGGAKNDTKTLIAGRKKAAKASAKDDKASIKYLKQIQKQLTYQKKTASKNGNGFDLDEDDRKKLSNLLADIFRNQVPSDWDIRKDLYNIALDVSRTLSSNEVIGTIWGDKDDQESVLYWLLDFRQQAKDIMKHHSDKGWSTEDQDDVALATLVTEVADMALKMSKRCMAAKPVADLCVVTMTERYQKKLGPLRFDSVDSLQNHYFLKKTPAAPTALNTRLLFKELAAYRNALPVEYGSSCFCRVINNRLDMLRVMITGPDDTPYANGCFLFDISMPGDYPKSNPKVQFLTTGGGRIRFNPNLYNCGKVCLSLLGTWAGKYL